MPPWQEPPDGPEQKNQQHTNQKPINWDYGFSGLGFGARKHNSESKWRRTGAARVVHRRYQCTKLHEAAAARRRRLRTRAARRRRGHEPHKRLTAHGGEGRRLEARGEEIFFT
eukprot:SAG31_NODE_2471_length_5648_cov_11.018382_2_plen_113_part_00